MAGVVVGIVALPLAIAFAIASGVRPEQGLYTAIVAGFLISALSGSRVQIGGPTGAFVVLVFSIVQEFGYDGLAVATLMRMRSVFALDSTGLHALEKVHERLKRHGTRLILSGVHAQPMDVLVRSGAYDRLGEENVCGSFREAVVRAWVLLDDAELGPGAAAPPARRERP